MSTKAELYDLASETARIANDLSNHADRHNLFIAKDKIIEYADRLDAVAVSDETALAVLTKYNDALPEGIEDVWPGERSVEIRVKCMCATRSNPSCR